MAVPLIFMLENLRFPFLYAKMMSFNIGLDDSDARIVFS